MKTRVFAVCVVVFLFCGFAHADSAKLVNPANGHSYQRFDTALNWNSAKTACAGLGGHLATITSQAENDWIYGNLKISELSPGAWIGGTDSAQEGVWKWITGELWSYTNWYTGEPSNGGGIENSLLIYGFCGQWNDGSETSTMSYLCEWDNSDGLITIPIDPNNFQTSGSCQLELTSEGMRVFNCGYRTGFFTYTKTTYNLVDTEVFIKFKPFGDGQYSGFGLAVSGADAVAHGYLLPDRSFPFGTTHHSYNGSIVINDGTWYFGRFKVKADKTFETTLSTGNYDLNGGVPIQQVKGTIADIDWGYFKNARLAVSGGDNYSAAAYVVLGELKIVPTTSCNNGVAIKPYTFTSGMPAKAAEVNANFDTIYTQMNCQIQALKAIVCTDHPTASICQ